MLEMKKYKADIEDDSLYRNGMTVEFWAPDEAQAKEKLLWLIGKNYSRNHYNLVEIEED